MNNNIKPYKSLYSFNERFKESLRILNKYPDRIPIICERSNITTDDCPYIDKTKYLAPNDLTIGQFLFIIRKRMKLVPEKALFLSTNNNILNSTQMLNYIYQNYHFGRLQNQWIQHAYHLHHSHKN